MASRNQGFGGYPGTSWIAWLVCVIGLVLGLQALLRPQFERGHARPMVAAQVVGPDRTDKPDTSYKPYKASDKSVAFETHQKLVEHWGKHGAEFGTITIDDYLKMAQRLRDAPVGGDVLEVVRDDGVATRFDRSSGAFLAFNPDRTIRTFFKPNDGESYFRRQARR